MLSLNVQFLLNFGEEQFCTCDHIFSKLRNSLKSEVFFNFVFYQQKLIDLNQKLLVTLGVSHSSLDQICHMTAKYGMHSKLTGAGGGGCAFTLFTPGTHQCDIRCYTL